MVYIYRNEQTKKHLLWLVLLGFSFSFFYYVREDSIWLLPLFIGSLIIVVVWNLFFAGYERKKKIVRTCFLLVPVLIFVGITCLYKGINYKMYGVFTTNDRTGGCFAELTGNMIRIKDNSDTNQDFWISRDKLESIVDECPSLAEHKDAYMDEYDTWVEDGDDGNVRGDLSVWSIRNSFNILGYYTTATTIDDFCSQVNDELLQAVDEGRLEFDDGIHFTTQSRGVHLGEIPAFIAETFKNIYEVVTFKDANPELIISSGDEGEIRYMESVMGVSTIKSESDPNYAYSGRIVRNSKIIVRLYRYISIVLFVVSLVCFLILCYTFIRKRCWDNFEPVIILLGFLLSIILGEFGITVFNSWLHNIWFYSSGTVTLCQCFEALSIAYIIKNRKK
jgi:hypothetical protein